MFRAGRVAMALAWLVLAPGCGSDAAPDEYDCVEGAVEFDGCNSCTCSEGLWGCGDKGCRTNWTPEEVVEGRMCHPLCPEDPDPAVLEAYLRCTVVRYTSGGVSKVLPQCGMATASCFTIAADRVAGTPTTEDDVGADCLAAGSGVELRFVGVDVTDSTFASSCGVQWAADPSVCAQ